MNRLLAVTLLAMSTACAEKAPPNADSTTALAATAAPAATVTIVSPAEGDTTGVDVSVLLHSSGVIIEKASGSRADGIGHYHLFVDTVATPEGSVIPPTTSHTIHIGSGDSTFTVKGLTPGAHELIAVLGFGDHTAMPSRRDTVRFVVR